MSKGLFQNKISYSENNHWWKPIEKAFNGIKVNGIKVSCPKCRTKGLAVTRWIKGLEIKPVYILHFERGKVKKTCKLGSLQAQKIKTEVRIRKGDIVNLMQNRKSFVLFSGGLDSLCMLSFLKEISETIKTELTAIYIDTTVGLADNVKYIRKVCRYLGVKLKTVKPKEDYFTLVKKWGIPSFRSRWCCRELKIKPVEEFLDKIEDPKVVFDGIRAVESRVREKYIPIWFHPSFECLSISPIFYWSDEEVKRFVNKNGLPKSYLHALGSSTECWCGAYKRKSDFEKLYDLDKSMFYKLVKVEEQNRNGYTFLYKNGERIPLKTLVKNK
jgi:3'-phosphoadenosine 5'-phosphosulfate sulfotransferase (PAPS reductase)/FAD synthetase